MKRNFQLQKPTKPKKLNRPTEPKKVCVFNEIYPHVTIFSYDDNKTTLSDLLNEFNKAFEINYPNVPNLNTINSIRVCIDPSGYYAEVTLVSTIPVLIEKHPEIIRAEKNRYDKLMEKYKKGLSEYERISDKYNVDLERYNLELEKYNKKIKEQRLHELRKEMLKLSEELND